MDAEEVLKLFDSCWFGIQYLKEYTSFSAPTSSHENSDHQIKEPSEPMLLRIQSTQVQHEVLPKKNITRRERKKKRQSKSLSDLEFEELKGFMDLGFVFSEEDKDSSLASIIPGLQRLGKSDEEEEDSDESSVQRPYLSEAWKVQERRKKENNPLMNWKIPPLNNEIDIKDNLRWWAHTVASTVR
uniref:Uncharacterized protein n=1 Tax=Cajanus cajan TaxID=3821 RepID=A0A151S6D8_CAJCA|nr:hypothetical protein KK1_027836 [Cajanus cajan]